MKLTNLTADEKKARHKQQQKEWREKNRAKVQQNWREWRLKNRDKVNAKNREWRKAKPDETAAYAKKYYAANRARIKEVKRASRLRNIDTHRARQRRQYHTNVDAMRAKSRAKGRTTSARFSLLKTKAKKRGQLVSISLQEYGEIIKHPCFYCQGQISDTPKAGIGVDRVRNDLGYEPFNCVSCCYTCNSIKNDYLSSRETLAAVQAIIEHRRHFGGGDTTPLHAMRKQRGSLPAQ